MVAQNLPLVGMDNAARIGASSDGRTLHVRDYQEAAINAVLRAYHDGLKSVLLCLATGTGKTYCAVESLRRLGLGRDGRTVVWIAHNGELLIQADLSVSRVIPYARKGWEIGQKTSEHYDQIIFGTVQSLIGHRAVSLFERLKDRLVMLVVDEAHRSASSSYRDLIMMVRSSPRGMVLGLTATPNRTDRVTLADLYDEIVYSYPTRDAIANGYLVRPLGYRVRTSTSLKGLTTSRGDFDKNKLAKRVNTEKRNELALSSWMKYAAGKKTLGFCANIEHALAMAELFNNAGIPSLAVSGKTPVAERRATFEQFKQRRILCLFGVLIFVEGFDDPGVEAIILAKPSKSSIYYQQALGRDLRPDAATAELLAHIPDAGTRLHVIEQSIKPYGIVIDLVDISARGVVTLETLFAPKTAGEGERMKLLLDLALPESESAIEETPTDMSSVIGIQERSIPGDSNAVEIRIEPFDLLATEQAMSRAPQALAWQNDRVGIRTLLLPKQRIGLMPDGSRSEQFEVVYHQAILDRLVNPLKTACRAEPTAKPGWMHVTIEVVATGERSWEIREKLAIDERKAEVRIVSGAENAAEAMQIAERYVRRAFPRVVALRDREAAWRSLPPKPLQIKVFEKRNLPVPATRGEAADAICELLSRKRPRKNVTNNG